MSLYNENDTGKAVCFHCKKITNITFKTKNMRIGQKTVDDVLVGICDICGHVIALPAQHSNLTKVQNVL